MPVMNLAVIALILGLAYFWAGQGLFSAFIHFVCVLVAGAVAFAVWEPLTYAVLIDLREDIAWTIGLLAPFAATLALLRVATNKLLPSNIDFSDGTNFVGGALFGGLAGVITAGVLVIGIGFLRVPADFLGYKPVDWDRNTGAVDKSHGQSLWVPADMLTARVYETLSTGALSTNTPLAKRMPNVHEQAGLVRVTHEGQSRTIFKPGDVAVTGRYTVTADNPRELVSDSFVISGDGSPVPQTVTLPDGSPPPAGSRIEGYVVRFEAGAKEKKGQTVIGASQIRLICDTDEGAKNFGPIAFITRASGSDLQVNRYRFDGPEVYAATVGGAADATMAFEFVVPPDARPLDLLIKNVRVPVQPLPLIAEDVAISQRDEMVRSGEVIGVRAESVSDPVRLGDASSGPETMSIDRTSTRDFRETTALGFTINKQDRGGLDLDSDNQITGGTVTLDRSRMQTNIPNILRVDQFQPPQGTTMVQVDVSPQSRMSLLGRTLDLAEQQLPPMLTDTLGQQFQAVGYIYEDQSKYEIRFTPGDPIRALSQTPTLSQSRQDQKLVLLFTPSSGVSIRSFGLGSRTQIEFDPPVELRRRR